MAGKTLKSISAQSLLDTRAFGGWLLKQENGRFGNGCKFFVILISFQNIVSFKISNTITLLA